jgi:peptidoglycan/LPS O-acetylase OafA/YrhL
MLQGFFRVAVVDGVYWTLSVELIFYGWALLCYRLGCLHRVPLLLTLLLAIRLVYFIAAQALHKDLPWIGYQFLILHYIPWFAAGISILRMSTGKGTMSSEIGVICAAALVLLITDGWPLCLLLLFLSVILYAAASDKLVFLNGAIPRFLGDISYTLYLLHENIGWALMRRMEEEGMTTNLAILLALTISISLATMVNRLIERPAMHWLRGAYRNRQLVTVGSR